MCTVELCEMLKNLQMTSKNLLLYENQSKEIKSKLIKYKENNETSDTYLYLSMCSGLTMDVIDEMCSLLNGIYTLDNPWP